MFCQGPSACFLIGKRFAGKDAGTARPSLSEMCPADCSVEPRTNGWRQQTILENIIRNHHVERLATSPFTGAHHSQSSIHLVIWHFSLTTGHTPLDAQMTCPHHAVSGWKPNSRASTAATDIINQELLSIQAPRTASILTRAACLEDNLISLCRAHLSNAGSYRRVILEGGTGIL